MKEIGKELFDMLSSKASEADRKRTHHNLHTDLNDKIQRLCVAIDPGSYIRPHRHPEPWKWEMFIVLQGAAIILTFDDAGQVTDRIDLANRGTVQAVEIPSNTWHTLAAQEKGTVLVEIKPGPYAPLAEQDFALWAPKEGSDKAVQVEALFHSAKTGCKLTDIKM
jgi:cupin fold WbuC family metalloprotein